jgi:type IV secretory pathway VirB10-like protein
LLPLTNQILKESFDIKPTIRLKQGARLIVKPFQNIIFEQKGGNIVRARLISDEVFNK